MLVPALLLALAASRSAADAVPDPSKGASLLHSCKAQARLLDLPSLDQAPAMDLVDGAYCLGYLNGFLSGLSPAAICTRQQTIAALIATYLRYMEQHPDLEAQDKRIGLRLALENAYPCPATEERTLPLQGGQHTGL